MTASKGSSGNRNAICKTYNWLKILQASKMKTKNQYQGCCQCSSWVHSRSVTSSSFRGGAIFMKFHSMTSSCLFNRGTTFSQTVTYNGNVLLLADTKSTVQTRTFCTTLVNKSRQNRTFCNSVGGWITVVKRNFWHAKFLISRRICACSEQLSTYQIRWENWWLGLRVCCLGKHVRLRFMLQLEKKNNWSVRLILIFFTGFSYSRTVACCGYLTSNQQVLIYTTRIKKVIAKLYFFTLRSKITDKK